MSKWTGEQEAAITGRNGSFLVSAAAGAGKTAVLVERIIRRILDPASPVDIDRVLVVTFTNAAAQEMKERIARELTMRRKESGPNGNLHRQLLLLGKASISTLHSFCLDLIKQNYYRLVLPEGLTLDPRFRITDDIEAALLKIEILNNLFEQKYTEEESFFFKLVECFGGERDDKILQDLVLKLYEFSRSQPDPSLWLTQATNTFNSDMEDSAVQDLFLNIRESITLPLEEALEMLKEAEAVSLSPGGPVVYHANLQQEKSSVQQVLSMFDGAGSGSSWPHLFEALKNLKFTSLKPCRDKDVDEELKNEAMVLRNRAKEVVKKIQREFLARSPQEYLEDMWVMAPAMNSLCLLVEEFGKRYLQAKLERNIIDFSDIEHFALQLLREEGGQTTALAERLRKRYEEILVDEYQDINSVQEAILQLVSREGEAANLFMVGDVKQSIYRFRLAEPGLFLAKYREYARYGTASRAAAWKIMLANNFRSRKLILDGVNYIFRQVMNTRLGGISYDDDAELVCKAAYPQKAKEEVAAIEVHLIERSEEINLTNDNELDEADELEEEELDALQLEARTAGRRINEMLAMQVWDKDQKEYRPICYRDIVVLMRSTKNSAAVFLEEFRQRGIPAYAEVGTGYLDAQEVQVIIALLRIIDNPRQDIPLAAVLRSAAVGLTAEELAEIRLKRPRGDFFNAVRLAARREKGIIGQKLRDFLRNLHRWRTHSRRHSLSELVWLLLRETGYYDYAGAMPGGKQRQANLRALHDRAKQYEDTAMKGLFKFLRFLERLEESNQDLGTARALGEQEDVVRIMSIHKSKGLEFPVVILAGLGRIFNHQDLREDILVDRDLGLGPVWVDMDKRLKYPTLAKIAVKNKIKRELLAEEIRILYVAMTRAREVLIMVGAMKDIAKKIKKWYRVIKLTKEELPPGILNGASCFWDWIGPCLLRHRCGRPLLELLNKDSEYNQLFLEDPSNWQIVIWNPRSLQSGENAAEQQQGEKLEKIKKLLPLDEPAGYCEFVQQRLGWKYPYSMLADIPAKLSVTEIKHRYHSLLQDEMGSQTISRWREFSKKPHFLQEDRGLSAQERGSALHLVMRHLNLDESLTLENIQAQLELFVKKRILSPAQGDSVSAAAIAGFFQSPLGQRLLKSRQVMREVPFTILLPADKIFEASLFSEKILVQGTIDCLFAEADGYIILDYKTDLVARETVDAFKERYRVQMDLYAQAVETILGKPVMEKILYSFKLACEFVLP